MLARYLSWSDWTPGVKAGAAVTLAEIAIANADKLSATAVGLVLVIKAFHVN